MKIDINVNQVEYVLEVGDGLYRVYFHSGKEVLVRDNFVNHASLSYADWVRGQRVADRHSNTGPR